MPPLQVDESPRPASAHAAIRLKRREELTSLRRRSAGEATLSVEGSPKPEPTWIFLLGRPMGFPEAKLEMGLGKLCHWTNQHGLQKGMMGQSMFL